MTSSISLCVISGNEQCHAERFLESFGPAFDELCIVRAIGNQAHDRTVAIAKKFCEKNGKLFKFAEYRNAGFVEDALFTPDAPIDDCNPATWKHVDDFAAARNMSWGLATGNWQLWADMDDVLDPEAPKYIRHCATLDQFDFFFFTYSIRTSMETNIRERMFRRGISRWNQPLHENCRLLKEPGRPVKEARCIFSHEPLVEKQRDIERNGRIMRWHMRYINAFPFELHREAYYKWSAWQKPEDAEIATKWAEIAQAVETLPDQRYDMLLHQSHIMGETDADHGLDLCWAACRINPGRRDSWGMMAELELKKGNAPRAVLLSKIMGSFSKPEDTGHPLPQRWFGWQGLYLQSRCYRSAGNEGAARKIEGQYFEKHGKKISLLHATRGRPLEALKARQNFFSAALEPLAIEHIFSIDEDDKESIEALKQYRHVIVKEPKGCVKAWNAAASDSQGAVLVQLSDDWLPCIHWDALIWNALTVESEKCGKPVGDVPLVLSVSDNHRTDQLLCMAILTRARYEQQGKEVFSSEYWGVFSDNHFTYRAYKDDVVVDAKHIVFDHQHPIWLNKPVEQWDETHRRQNHPDRYSEGKAIFNRLNPEAAIP